MNLRGVSCLAEDLLATEEGLCSMELVTVTVVLRQLYLVVFQLFLAIVIPQLHQTYRHVTGSIQF